MQKVRRHSLKQNLFFNFIYQVVVILSPLVVTPKFSRVMGADYVGLKSYTYSIVYYFALIGALGLDMYGQRRIAIIKDDEEERSRVFLSVYLVKMACCFVSLSVYFVAFVLLNHNSDVRILYLCWTLYLVREMINPVWYLQGIERFKLVSILNIISQVVYVLCVYLFINTKEDLWLYILFYAAIPLAIAIIFIPFVLKDIKLVPLSKQEIFLVVKESLVYFVPTFASALYSMIDKTMLGVFDETKVTTGYYEQAEKLVKVALAFSTASFTIVRTRMSYVLKNESQEVYRSYNEKFISFSMLLCWPIIFGIIGIAKDFVPLFFGEGYGTVIVLVYVFVWVIPCLTISGLLQAIYIFPYGLQNKMNIYYIIVLCVNVVLNLFLIPKFDAYGAVIASICSELLLAIVLLYKAKSKVDVKLFFVKSIRYIIAATTMLLVVLSISKFQMPLLHKLCLEFVCGVVAYFVVSLVLRDSFLILQVKKVCSSISKNRRR